MGNGRFTRRNSHNGRLRKLLSVQILHKYPCEINNPINFIRVMALLRFGHKPYSQVQINELKAGVYELLMASIEKS